MLSEAVDNSARALIPVVIGVPESVKKVGAIGKSPCSSYKMWMGFREVSQGDLILEL